MEEAFREYHSLLGQLTEVRSKVERLIEAHGDAPEPQAANVTADAVRRLIKARTRRRRLFPGLLFAEPAWNMLLELYLAHLEGRKQAQTSLALTSDVPATTAQRWIISLAEEGWLNRSADTHDARRVLVELSQKGQVAMNKFFSQSELAPLINGAAASPVSDRLESDL